MFPLFFGMAASQGGATVTDGTWALAGGSNKTAGNMDGQPGLQFTASASGSVAQVRWNVTTAGTAVEWECRVYSDDGATPGHPQTLLYTSSNSQSVGSTGDKTWTFSGAAIVAATKYWIVLAPVSSNTNINLATVGANAAFGSGRNGTITSIAATGQTPKTNTEDWKVEILISV